MEIIQNLYLVKNDKIDRFMLDLEMINIFLMDFDENYFKVNLETSEISICTAVFFMDLIQRLKKFSINKVSDIYIVEILQ